MHSGGRHRNPVTHRKTPNSSTAKFGNSAHFPKAQGRRARDWLPTHFLSIYICAGFRNWPFLNRSFNLCEKAQVQSV